MFCVIDTVTCFSVFRGSYEQCENYLKEHPLETACGGLTILTLGEYERMCSDGRFSPEQDG